MSDIIQALRRYFLGLTIIAGISTAGVVIGSLIVGLPLLGTIAIITFLASYVPIIGAWTAGSSSSRSRSPTRGRRPR